MNSESVPPWLLSLLDAAKAAVFSWVFWVGVGIPALLWLGLRWRFRMSSVSVPLAFGLGSATFDTTATDRVLAWRFYVQLVTRKAALPFKDEDGDLVSETFDSLYDLFTVARSLLSDLPPSKHLGRQGIASLVIAVLNSGVRPLLTRWHADFRRWWNGALQLPDNATRTPQAIQREYPRYDQLVADLERTNTELSKFADELLDIASGRSRHPVPSGRIKPLPPAQGEADDEGSEPK